MRGNTGRAEAAVNLLGSLAERLAAGQIHASLLSALAHRLENGSGFFAPETLDRFLQQELRHTLLLERSIRGLGGSPAAMTPASRRGNASATALQRVVRDADASLAEALDALLVAGVRDRQGWEQLVELADRQGFASLAWEFRGALLEEREQESTLTAWRDRCALP